MAAIAQRMCPYCGRTIGDRTRTKCPNFQKHIAACERKHSKPTPDQRPTHPVTGEELPAHFAAWPVPDEPTE